MMHFMLTNALICPRNDFIIDDSSLGNGAPQVISVVLCYIFLGCPKDIKRSRGNVITGNARGSWLILLLL